MDNPYTMIQKVDDNIAPFFEATVGFFGQTFRTVIATLALLNYPHIVIQRDLPKVNGGVHILVESCRKMN